MSLTSEELRNNAVEKIGERKVSAIEEASELQKQISFPEAGSLGSDGSKLVCRAVLVAALLIVDAIRKKPHEQ